MAEAEGVIKYRLVFTESAPLVDHNYSALDYWHRVFKQAGVLGQDPQRYGGLGFGNISQRVFGDYFLISGTQTGQKSTLLPEDYALVTGFDIQGNTVEARGAIKPSSEALTHAAIYNLDKSIEFVFHVHCPEIWRARDRLGLIQTAADVHYGSPAMASEIAHLFAQGLFDGEKILAMAGHEDGIIGFGETAEEAGQCIVSQLGTLK